MALGAVAAAAVILIAASPALAKKKHKKKKGLGPVVTVTAGGNTVSASGQVSTAVATCPAGTQAVGGGFSAPYNTVSVLVIFQSYRSGPGSWTASGMWMAGASSATSYAYCRRASRPILDVAGTGTVSGSYGLASASAACPAPTKLIGGGFQSTFTAPFTTAFPQSNLSTAPETWSLVSFNIIGTNTVTAHAYCTSGIREPTLVSATTSALGQPGYGSVTALSPVCPTPKKNKKKRRRKNQPAQLISDGGFSSPPGTAASALPGYTESHIGADGWLATAVNAMGGSTGTLSVTSQGICA